MLTPFRGLSLRQVIEEDLPFVFRLYSDPARNHLWTPHRRVLDERAFQEAWGTWMNMIFAARFIVERKQRPIGLVLAYDHYPEHGFAKVGAMLAEEHVGHGGGVIATALLTDFLFRTLPLRKIYLETYGFNPSVLRILRKLGLPEEGCLKGDHYFDGEYWNLHIFAVYRESWADIRARVLRVTRQRDVSGAMRNRSNGLAILAAGAGISRDSRFSGDG
jgi:RimJ/RimL family protein N-acetyltransferase